MAAPMMKGADDSLRTINEQLEYLLYQNNVHVKGLKVGKRNNEFTRGDIFLSRGCTETKDHDVMTSVRECLMKELSDRGCFIKSISEDKFNSVVIYLNRTKYFEDVIKCVLTERDKYGVRPSQQKEVILVNTNFHTKHKNTVETQTMCDADKMCNFPFDSLRTLFIQDHLTMLLNANGYDVTNILPQDQSDTVEQICHFCGIDTAKFTKIHMSDEEMISVLKSLEGHSCLQEIVGSTGKTGNSAGMTEVESSDFDLKKFLEEKNLNVGKNWFDKNLKTCCVRENGVTSSELHQAGVLFKCLKQTNCDRIIHIEGQSLSFTAQKVDLLLRTLVESEKLHQVHLVHGSVTKSKGSHASEDINVDSYLKLRYKQMKEAAVMKYGDSVQGDGWEDTLKSLTLACVKFELLSNASRSSVKLKLDSGQYGASESDLQGSFVMYNCARLNTLLSHFDEKVENGTYPPLPTIDAVDFSTLREEEEWGLLFNFVYPFPDLVKEAVKDMETGQSLFVSLHTHKICQMLVGLSRSVSSYYSRYHVLGESRPHLLSTMYARLYLLKAVHQVMINSLKLLEINPLSQL